MTGNPILVSSVCEGIKFMGLGDDQGLMEKLQDFISLMEFIATFFHCVKRTLPQFLQKQCFETKLAEKPKFSNFETISGFYSSLLVESN